MKKTITLTLATLVSVLIVGCTDYTSTKTSTTTIDSHNVSTSKVTYLMDGQPVVDENGTVNDFATVCNIDSSHVTPQGGYVVVQSEVSAEGLPSEFKVQVGDIVATPVATYTDYGTVKLTANVQLPANDTGEPKRYEVATYATDGQNRINICGGYVIQQPITPDDTNSTVA